MKERKQQLYLSWLNTKGEGHKREFREVISRFKGDVINAKNQSWENKCQELVTYIGGRQSRE